LEPRHVTRHVFGHESEPVLAALGYSLGLIPGEDPILHALHDNRDGPLPMLLLEFLHRESHGVKTILLAEATLIAKP